MSSSSYFDKSSQAFYRTFTPAPYNKIVALYPRAKYALIPARFFLGLLAAPLYILRTLAYTLFNPQAYEQRFNKFALSWVLAMGLGAAGFFAWEAVTAVGFGDAVAVFGFSLLSVSASITGAIVVAFALSVVVAAAFMAVKAIANVIERNQTVKTSLHEALLSAEHKDYKNEAPRKLSRTGRRLSVPMQELIGTIDAGDSDYFILLRDSGELEKLYQNLKQDVQNANESGLRAKGFNVDLEAGLSIFETVGLVLDDIKYMQAELAGILESLKNADAESVQGTQQRLADLKGYTETFIQNLPHEMSEKTTLSGFLSRYKIEFDNTRCCAKLVKETNTVQQTAKSKARFSLLRDLHVETPGGIPNGPNSVRTYNRLPSSSTLLQKQESFGNNLSSGKTPRWQRRADHSDTVDPRNLLLAKGENGLYYYTNFDSSSSEGSDGHHSETSSDRSHSPAHEGSPSTASSKLSDTQSDGASSDSSIVNINAAVIASAEGKKAFRSVAADSVKNESGERLQHPQGRSPESNVRPRRNTR
jgi:hypothetical protein